MALYLTFIAIAAAVVAFFSALFNNLASTEISNRIKRAYFNSVTSQEIAFFDYKKGGHLLKLITEDVTKITASYSGSLSTISMSMGQLIAGAVLAFKSSWSMTLLGFCSIPFIIIIVIISGLTTSYLTRRADTQLSGSVSTANEVISSMKTVRSMAGEKKEVDRYNRDLSKIGVTGALSALCQGFSVGLNGFFLWAALSLSFWFAGRLVNEGSMLPGNLISMWGYIVMSAVGIQNVSQ
jgi:ATP-binding cassette subfamily B (MDR/TAP) protein 1